MKKHKESLRNLVLLVGLVFILSGCSFAGRNPTQPYTTIDTPEELSGDLSNITLFFTKNLDDKTSVYITSLNQEVASTITLQNEGGGLKMSQSGSYLAYRYGERVNGEYHSGIWIRDLKEGVERKVILWPEEYTVVQLNNPNFFPEEDKLIFSITWYETDTVGLATVKMNGSDFQVIDTPQGKLNEGPKISPDGEKILVLCSGIDIDSGQPGFMLCIMNSDGSDRILLTKSGSYHGTYLFTPDSQSIIYSEAEWGGLIGLIDQPYYQIRSIDIDGKNLHTILDWHRAINVLALSNDGDEIIYIDRPDSGKTSKMYIVDKDGTNLRHLAYLDEFLADWYSSE
jgi:Tol biopolymer transport system component